MKQTKEEILKEKIKDYNLTVNDIYKFKLDKNELSVFESAMQTFADQETRELKEIYKTNYKFNK